MRRLIGWFKKIYRIVTPLLMVILFINSIIGTFWGINPLIILVNVCVLVGLYFSNELTDNYE